MLVKVIRITISSRHHFHLPRTREVGLEVPEVVSGCLGSALCLASPVLPWLVSTTHLLTVAVIAEAPLSTGSLLASHTVTTDHDALGVVIAIAHRIRALTQWAFAGSHIGSRS